MNLRMTLALNDGMFGGNQNANIAVINATSLIPSEMLSNPNLQLVQWHFPEYSKLSHYKDRVKTSLDGEFEAVCVSLTRYKKFDLSQIGTAVNHINLGGTLLLDGQKDQGIDSIIKMLRKIEEPISVWSKSHGKLAAFNVTEQLKIATSDWKTYLAPYKNNDGYLTSLGSFSAEKIDEGSRYLIENLPKKIGGTGADFGAGCGYLSYEVFRKYPSEKSLSLIEANFFALEMAKKNVLDDRAEFLWGDATSGMKNMYDFIIMNPPFHHLGPQDAELGSAFIRSASVALKNKGQLFMVANRQLPYEKDLSQQFKSVTRVAENKLYKVYRASGRNS